MSALQILIDARKKIEDPERWAASLDDLCLEKDCASTALGRDWDAHAEFCKANDLDPAFAYSEVISFNDAHDHVAVLAGFDRAIAALSSQLREKP